MKKDREFAIASSLLLFEIPPRALSYAPCVVWWSLSQVTLPSKKQIYRLIGRDGIPLVDLICREAGDAVPIAGEPYLCRHPADDTKQVRVKATTVVPLLHRVWLGKNYTKYCASRGIAVEIEGLPDAPGGVNLRMEFPTLAAIREYSKVQLASFRDDHKRPLNPTPYKVRRTSLTQLPECLTLVHGCLVMLLSGFLPAGVCACGVLPLHQGLVGAGGTCAAV